MAHCPACGADLPAGARFCPACGTRLEGRPWTRRALAVLLISVAALALIAITFLTHQDSKHPAPAVAAATSVPATPIVLPTATPSGLLAASGSGAGNTATFTVSRPGWATNYAWDCTHGQTTSNEEFVLGIALSDQTTGKTAGYVTVPGEIRGHSTHIWNQIGTFRFNVLTEPGCTWSINIPAP